MPVLLGLLVSAWLSGSDVLIGDGSAADVSFVDGSAADLTVSSLYAGMVLDWRLTSSATDGTNATDRAAGHYLGAPVASAAFGADGVTVNGTTQYVKNSTAAFRGADSQGSIAVWFSGDGTQDGVIRYLLTSADEAVANSFVNFGIYTNDRAIIGQRNAGGSNTAVYGSTSLAGAGWHLLVVTSSGTSWTIYVDGGSAETISVIVGSNNGDWFADTNGGSGRDNIAVGAICSSSCPSSPFAGTIGRVMIWNRPITQSESTHLYNLGRD